MSLQENESAVPRGVQHEALAEPRQQHRTGWLTALKREREALTQRVTMLGDAVSRSRAELDNFRKRTRRAQEDLVRYANEDLIGSLLDVVDNLDRALDAGAQNDRKDDPFITGVGMISQQLWNVLAERGLERMEVVGEAFNPERHEAIETEIVTDKPPNVVLAEHRAGYLLNGKVLRAALVKVSKDEQNIESGSDETEECED